MNNEASSGLARHSFTGRIAGWSARHRWPVLGGTVGVLVVAILLSSSLGIKTSEVVGAGDARRGAKLIEDRFDIVKPRAEVILLSNPNLDVAADAFRSTVAALVEELKALEGVVSVGSYSDHLSNTLIPPTVSRFSCAAR